MNERFKELSKQAWDYVQACGRYDKTSTQLFDEKFAELIVRECVDVAYEYDAPKMSGPGMIIAGRIETHFGVDE